MRDEEIIELFYQRDEKAIQEVKNSYEDDCKRMIYKIIDCREDVEECLNDTYMELWNNIPPTQPICLYRFVTKVAQNMAYNKLRYNRAIKRRANHKTILKELDNIIDFKYQYTSQYDRLLLTKAIETFLLNLKYEDRYIFMRRYWFEDTIEEVSHITGIGKSAIKMRLFRNRKRLGKYLVKENWVVFRKKEENKVEKQV